MVAGDFRTVPLIFRQVAEGYFEDVPNTPFRIRFNSLLPNDPAVVSTLYGLSSR